MCSVDNVGDFHCFVFYPVNHDERERRQWQLTCAFNPSLSPSMGKLLQGTCAFVNSFCYPLGRIRIFAVNILNNTRKVLNGGG